MHVASDVVAHHPRAAARPPAFLAADVGGTHVRVGRITAADGQQPVQVQQYRKYRCADFPSLAAILLDFLDGDHAVHDCVIASAGFALQDGTVISANLPWPLSLQGLRRELGLDSVHLVNDFEAVAYAATRVGDSQVLQLAGPEHGAGGPALVLGPGTGLGAAVWIPTANGPVVLPTEAGQAALAATTDLEMALVRRLHRQHRHVSVEHALSGPGLLNLYRALAGERGQAAVLDTPDDISAAALAGSDPLAVETLQVFCGLLGSVVGDMALLYGIQRGIYLAGGILPKIAPFLAASDFVARFLDKGPMRAALERIPVRLVEHGQLGVLGAAHWFIDRYSDGDRAPAR